MALVFTLLLAVFFGYMVGTFNPSYLLGKAKGFDIRERGSGNAGASNVIITLGKGAGVVIMVLDILKAVFVVWACGKLFPQFGIAKAAGGVACVLGHIFPFYMHFKGGKGLACLGGLCAAYNVRLFLVCFGAAVLLSFLTDYICFVPITASVAWPFLYGGFTGDWISALIYCILPFVMIYKHLENLRRIRNGTEARFSFLWKKNEEIERLQHNQDNQV